MAECHVFMGGFITFKPTCLFGLGGKKCCGHSLGNSIKHMGNKGWLRKVTQGKDKMHWKNMCIFSNLSILKYIPKF
jgi:hypothetical protein